MTHQACDWNGDQIETLTRLWLDGVSASQIAICIEGATRNAVIGKVRRLGLPSRKTRIQLPPGGGPRNPRRATKPRKPKVVKAPKRKPTPKPDAYAFTADVWEPLAWATPVTLEHVTGCRWPASDPFAPVGSVDLFCNCKPVEGKSYCAEHQARSVGNGTVSEQTAVRVARHYGNQELRQAA